MQSLIPSDISERVTRGVEYLDIHLPRWWQELDRELLDPTNVAHCILDQLRNKSLIQELDSFPTTWDEMVEHGFLHTSFSSVKQEYQLLSMAWTEAIKQQVRT